MRTEVHVRGSRCNHFKRRYLGAFETRPRRINDVVIHGASGAHLQLRVEYGVGRRGAVDELKPGRTGPQDEHRQDRVICPRVHGVLRCHRCSLCRHATLHLVVAIQMLGCTIRARDGHPRYGNFERLAEQCVGYKVLPCWSRASVACRALHRLQVHASMSVTV